MKNISVYIDTVFCAVVLPAMMLIFPVERWFHNFTGYVVAVGVWLYVLYFVNRAVTVPFLFGNRRRRTAAAVLIAASLAVTYVFSSVTLYTPKPNIHDAGLTLVLPHAQQYQQAVWSLFMIVEAFSFAVGLLTQTGVQRARRRAVEAQRDKAMIELYKAQIKPHFMFNTLNSLYGLFLTRDENALPSLEKFISMMKYIHTSSTRDLVPLDDEADYIRRYVGLQSLRLNGMTSVRLDIDIPPEASDMSVPPMLLVTFVENCFKHGVSPVEPSAIDISLRAAGGRLCFRTANRIFPARRIGEHMGIKNCRRRLELVYPGRHFFHAGPEGGLFIVELQIDFKE